MSWFYAFVSKILTGFVQVFTGLFNGMVTIFNIPEYIKIFNNHYRSFGMMDWIFAIISIILVAALWVLVFYLIFLGVRRYIRMRRMVVSQEDIFEEVADLHNEILRLTNEKDRILTMKVSQSGISARALAEAITEITAERKEAEKETAEAKNTASKGGNQVIATGESRFSRLTEVDRKYSFYTPPNYVSDMTLPEVCEAMRNFACSQMGLYYDLNMFRCVLAGFASTKMILLQGISGTGKTSLPYCMGKFFTHDATIASVQPSWRDRTELFGYFNEFTKRFNETEVLKRIYEASYNDDVNIIVLDEMNIARVEYYFAEMLSILEMPDSSEWKLDLVSNSWDSDPHNIIDGKLIIPQNLWYVGTANNDDSTFAISDKVYDRALTISLDSKGEAFEAPLTEPCNISYAYLESLFDQAIKTYAVSKGNLEKISRLDIFIIQKLRIAFGNRIMKQLNDFVPVYVACGGTELDGIDYILATKVFRKFESLNLSMVREELKELSAYLTKNFGKNNMNACKNYLERLQKLF